MQTSKLFSLNAIDFGKGVIVAVGGAALTVVQQTVAAGSLTFNWHAIESVALAAAASYLLKNFFTVATVVTPAETK